MSQVKVDRYKQKKQLREEEARQKKIKSLLSKIFVAIFCLAFVFWLGYSIYFSVKGPVRSRTVVNAEAIDTYLDTLNETEANTEAETDEDAETDAEDETDADTDAEDDTDAKAETDAEDDTVAE